MASTKWDDPDRDILGDVAAAAESIREGGEVDPDLIVVNLEQYAWLVLGRYLFAITLRLSEVRTYKLPKSSFMDHIRDCFGWKKPVEKVTNPYTRAMVALFKEKMPSRSLFMQQFGRFSRRTTRRAVDYRHYKRGVQNER